MLLKFIKLCIVFIIIGGGVFTFNRPDIRDKIISSVQGVKPALPDVKGLSTNNVGSISGQLKTDIDNGIILAQKQALNLKIGDLVNIYHGYQKIANDFRSLQENVKGQVENFGKK